MKKRNLFLILTSATLLISSCSKQPKREREDDPSDDPGEVDITVEELKDDELNQFPSLFIAKLNEYNSYNAITSGKTIANVFGIDVNQSIEVNVIKGTYSYLLNKSDSNMQHTIHTAYYYEDKVLCSDVKSIENMNKYSLEEYLSIYGTYPFDKAIEGYSIANGAIKTITRTKVEDNYKLSLVFDKELSTNNVKIQMKKFGGLDDYPIFKEDISMDIVVKNDFTPISLNLSSHYVAKKIMDSDCKQNYIVTYSKFNEEIDIPNLEQIKPQFID